MNLCVRAERTRRAVKVAVTPVKLEDSDEEEEADEGPVDTSDDEEDDRTPIRRRSKRQMYV